MRLALLLLPSLAMADVSTSKDLEGEERFVQAPLKKGWFQLPGGYELTFVEGHDSGKDGYFLRKDGVRTRFDSRELRPDECNVDSLNEVHIGSHGSLEAEVICDFDSRKNLARTTLARVTARFHEARTDLRQAIARDPTLASARVALARSQDREAAIATILASLQLPSFYLEALEDAKVAPLLNDVRVVGQLPRDGDAKAGELAWSSRLQRIAWFQDFDYDSDEPSQRLVIQTLGGHVDHFDWTTDKKIVERYLHDMGFKAGRELKEQSWCHEDDEDKPDVPAWKRSMRWLGAPGLSVDEQLQVSVRGRKLFKAGNCDHELISWTAGYLPEVNSLYERAMPHGPCTVGGAPAARSWIAIYPLGRQP